MTEPAAGDPPQSTAPHPAADDLQDIPASPVFGLPDEGFVRGRKVAPVGPGLPEALLWVGGFFVIEVCGMIAWAAMLAALRIAQGLPPFQPGTNPAEVLGPWMGWAIGSIKFLEVLAVLLAIRVRYGRRAFRVTGFTAPSWPHAAVMTLAVLPTAICAGQCYAAFSGLWERLRLAFPRLPDVTDLSSVEAVQKMAADTPAWALVLIVAVGPALGEEFLFRAAIGRGLVARWGRWPGILLTSFLFAAVHLSPTQAAALLPLAVLLHVGYLSSGSIWTAVGVHFVNNALFVVLMKAAMGEGGTGAVAADSQFSPLLAASAGACVAATVWLLLRMPVRYETPDGRDWRPARPGVEPPPRGEAVRRVTRPGTAPLAMAAICYGLFPVAMAANAYSQPVIPPTEPTVPVAPGQPQTTTRPVSAGHAMPYTGGRIQSVFSD